MKLLQFLHGGKYRQIYLHDAFWLYQWRDTDKSWHVALDTRVAPWWTMEIIDRLTDIEMVTKGCYAVMARLSKN